MTVQQLSGMDAAFLHLETPTTPMQVVGIYLFIRRPAEPAAVSVTVMAGRRTVTMRRRFDGAHRSRVPRHGQLPSNGLRVAAKLVEVGDQVLAEEVVLLPAVVEDPIARLGQELRTALDDLAVLAEQVAQGGAQGGCDLLGVSLAACM